MSKKVAGNFISYPSIGSGKRQKIFKTKKMFDGKVKNPFNPPIKIRLHKSSKRLRA